MEKGVQILLGVIVVLIVIVGAVLVFMPEEQQVPKATGHAVKVQKAAGPIKIGVSLPLSGEAASYGQGMLGGAEMAVEEINADGGVNGRKLVLVVEDDQCDSKGGVNAMNKLVNVDEVDAIVGPLCSAAAGASLPLAQGAHTPTIFWGSAPHLTSLGDYLFRTYPSDLFQGGFAAEFLYNELGKRDVSVIYVQNDWGQGIADVFAKRFEELGGTVVFNEGVAQDAKDFRSVVSKAKAKNPDSLYLPLYPAGGVNALKQVRELGIDVPIVSGDAFDVDELVGSGYAEGVMYTVGKINEPDWFKQGVAAKTGRDTNSWTALPYDAVHIFAKVMGDVGTSKDDVKAALNRISYTDGVSLSKISFDSKGDLQFAEFLIKVVEDGEWHYMDE